MSSGLGDTLDVEGKPCVSIGHCRSPVPSTVLALSRCSYKSVGELRRVGRFGQGALCKGWPLCIQVKRGKVIAMVCVGMALAFALGDSEHWKTSQSANGGSQFFPTQVCSEL